MYCTISVHVSLALTILLTQGHRSSQDVGYFWHITDMHWDPTYSTQAKALSCNSGSPQSGYGQFGNHKCDPPMTLINSSVHAMKTIFPNPDYLIWTGDDTPHIYNDTILHEEAVLAIISNLTTALNNAFPEKVVYAALGNHDWSPKSQLAPHNHRIYENVAAMWSNWLTHENVATFREGGFYAANVTSSFKILSLNTNLYYTSNKLTANLSDPAGQWQWLENELHNASSQNQKVVIVSHVPPGTFEKHKTKHWFYPNFNQRFISIISRYASIISAMHFGHHHTDSFKLVYDAAGTPVSSILLAPAVTPWETTLPETIGGRGNNPAVRLVKYDRESGQTLDVSQYYLNLTEANEKAEARWRLLYNATQYYGLPDMGTQSLHSLASSFLEDSERFHKYYQANGVLYDPEETCEGECRIIQYCSITCLDYEDYDQCFQSHSTPTSGSVQLRAFKFVWVLLFAVKVDNQLNL